MRPPVCVCVCAREVPSYFPFHASCSDTSTRQSDRTRSRNPDAESPSGVFVLYPDWERRTGCLRERTCEFFVKCVCVCVSITKRLFGPGVITELVQQRYFGSALDPSQSAMSSSQIKHMMAV